VWLLTLKYEWLQETESLLEKLAVGQTVKNFSTFTELGVSFPVSQETTTNPYPKPDEFTHTLPSSFNECSCNWALHRTFCEVIYVIFDYVVKT
jgi:hypothetical protein